MVDVVDKATRSRMMSGIRSKNTKPEKLIRSALHRHGFRFRLNQTSLPGKPDLVFRKYRAVIFIHGCFWHGHNCDLFKWPSSNSAFWRNKIERNRANDIEVIAALKKSGWRVMVIWECALKGKVQMTKLPQTVERICLWLSQANKPFKEISRGAAAWHKISG